ncbi:molybdenum cofactor biosynthesis F family protein [Rathayibacter soli]|uniref:molybdenum cofactor biosynthesis F family protein n=1 Tax=Rathayibacter soli TaxID=3144168 RepID=UPI0027E4C99F|nr:molybdenum cofactor biosynthesis F family protein [Glaciibacter superstes]
MTNSTLTDTSTWLPLDGLAPGFDANKAPLSPDLAGRTVVITNGDGSEPGSVIAHEFTADRVRWHYEAVATDPHGTADGDDAYEAIEVDDDLFYVQFQTRSRSENAVSLFLDFASGRALTVVQAIHERADDNTCVWQAFVPGTIDSIETTGEEPAPTNALIGRRVVWDYSPIHAYEHIYLSPQWYTWQCLAGPEKGLADTDQNTVYRLREGIYVFAWREKVIPCASVTVADHRNVRAIRSHGVLFGLDETGRTPMHFTFGAYGRLLSVTVHPDRLDPAL